MDDITAEDCSQSGPMVSKNRDDIQDPINPFIRQKTAEKNLLVDELNQVSEMMNQANLTNKEMLHVISDKLSNINESLNLRQRKLISILSNSSDPDEVKSEIQKIKNPDFKLRTILDFEKMIDQFFACGDQSMDFKLFSNEISICIDESNSQIEIIESENQKENELLKKRISLIEAELSDIKNNKIESISGFQDYFSRNYLGLLESLTPQLQEIKQEQSKNNGLVNEIDNKVRNLEKGLEIQTSQNLSRLGDFLALKEFTSKSIEKVILNAEKLANGLKDEVILISCKQRSQETYLMASLKALKGEFNILKQEWSTSPDKLNSMIDNKFKEAIKKLTQFIEKTLKKNNFKYLDLGSKINSLSDLGLTYFDDLESCGHEIFEIIKSEDEKYAFICNYYIGNLYEGIFN